MAVTINAKKIDSERKHFIEKHEVRTVIKYLFEFKRKKNV